MAGGKTTQMASKRPRSVTTATNRNGSATAPPMYDALSTRSGNVVVLGLQPGSAVNCAGMALLRVFQGHAELLGWRPRLGIYYPVYSPKWSSLLVVEARSRESVVAASSLVANQNVHDAEAQGAFSEASAQLLATMEPNAATTTDLEEEHEADRLARQVAETYAVVLVIRAMPITYGNVMCFFEVPNKHDVVLPGFKIITTKDAYQSLTTGPSNFVDETAQVRSNGAGPVEHNTKKSAQVLAELVVADPSRLIQISQGWSTTVDALERSLLSAATPKRIVVCGGKDVGKSTFCRYLVNRLLSFYDVVAFLDTDLGQPELTPPGMVSLHALTTPLLGPGFTHMKTPLRSFFCGGTNPGTDPLYYVKAVKSLLRLYDRKWGTPVENAVPLVINTDGWVKSMGHDLLCNVITDAAPHHVVQLLSTTRSKQFDVPTAGNWKIHSVEPWDPSMSIVQAPRSSKEMRLYRLHSYFLSHTKCNDLARSQLQNLHFLTEKDRLTHAIAHAYASTTPLAVSFDAIDIGFVANPVPPSQLLASLNCSIVGLCINPQRSPQHDDSDGNTQPRPPRLQVHAVHAPCVGVGLIRAIDPVRRLLYVLSPVSLRVLQHVNLLVRASVSLDPLLLGAMDNTVLAPYVVTDVIASDGTGSAAMQSRNNIKRKRDGGKNDR